MAIKDALLPEFDHEMASTRTLLERVPDGRGGWKPHTKSMSVGELAMHVAEMSAWPAMTLEQDELDFNPPGGTPYRTPGFETAAGLIAIFDANVKASRAALARATDEQFMQKWALKNGGVVLMSMPRAAVMRSFVLNHIIHHRGQLTVYLRLLDVPLPSIYGPTADLKQQGGAAGPT
jgi:uncharacterized damage-inducible protein DinB